MKLVSTLSLLVVLVAQSAHAASLKEIFQSIADATDAGNGNGHLVTELKGSFNEKREIAKLNKEVNPKSPEEYDCVFEVQASIESAIRDLGRKVWDLETTAARLEGLHRKGLIQQIVYSAWDGVSGNSEYCYQSTMRVFGVDGSILELNLDQTD